MALDLDRWAGPVTPGEQEVLDRARGPVLDVGCGPARHIRALAARGILGLGVDPSYRAVEMARARGTQAVWQASVFDDLPRDWGSALLLDGSVGIGGDPIRLLRRVRELLRSEGCALVETEPPGVRDNTLEVLGPDGELLIWSRVGASGLPALARAAGFSTVDRWCCEGRWFGMLR